MPLDIQSRFGRKWLSDDEEGGKNQYEEDFLADLLQRLRLDKRMAYRKVLRLDAGRELVTTPRTW
jgi:hypothetical protein